MSESLCLTIEEQQRLVNFISRYTETSTHFLNSIDESNVTEHSTETIALVIKAFESSKSLTGLLNKIKYNIEEYNKCQN
jgi:hypothetical protein|tara:strand:- start:359 stop:595 length:237 start_codon:yes stop_codon:yes gene_type:complete